MRNNYDVPHSVHAVKRLRRSLMAMLTGAVLTLAPAGLMLAFAGPALAHNVVISTQPADGASLDAAPQTVTVTFDQPVQNFEPVMKVFGPNGNDFATGPATVLGSTVSVTFGAGPAGEYRAAYRVVSADGHPVAGEFTFTLAAAAAGDATGTPTNAPDPGAAQAESGAQGVGTWVWVLVGMAAVVLLIALVITLARRR